MPLASIPSPSEGVWYLGFIPIRAYALSFILAIVFGTWLSERRWRARGGEKGTISDIAVPAVIFGLIGARLYHVITDWQTYFGPRAIKEPYRALFIWEGGLSIWGAVALGGVGVWLVCRRRGLSLGAVADAVAPSIAFGQAIARWGNWFNQELYGSPTTLPWGLEIDQAHGGEPGVLYHPTFLYESLSDAALAFGLILAGRRFTLRHGRLFAPLRRRLHVRAVLDRGAADRPGGRSRPRGDAPGAADQPVDLDRAVYRRAGLSLGDS